MQPSSRERLIQVQEALARESPPSWRPVSGTQIAVGACFAIFEKGIAGAGAVGDRVWASAVLFKGLPVIAARGVDEAVVEGHGDAPYEPGLLFLRTGHVLLEALHRLRNLPDVLIVDGTGRDHPRRSGLAFHLGAILDVPTVGVTHRPLVATGEWPEGTQTTTPLRIGSEIVGFWVMTKRGARPLAVHAGWRTDAEIAAELVMGCVRRARTPEPLRRARQIARVARAKALE
ncbi:MAG: endonuclease V [Chloroflexi bacterium]|nr:endonuclease V [Chloroflexota bacterium]